MRLRPVMNNAHEFMLKTFIDVAAETLMDVENRAAALHPGAGIEIIPKHTANHDCPCKADGQNAHFNDEPEPDENTRNRHPWIKRCFKAGLIGRNP